MRELSLLISISFLLLATRYGLKSQNNEQVTFSEFVHIDVNGILGTAAWSPADRQLVLGGENGLYLYDDDFALIEHLQIEENDPFVIDVDWSPDGEFLASIHFDGRAYLWDMQDIAIVSEWQPHISLPTHISWYPYGSKISTSSWDGIVKVFDAVSLEPIDILVDNELGPIEAIGWLPDHQSLTFKTVVGPEVLVWDVLTDQMLDSVTSAFHKLPSLSADGSLLAMGGRTTNNGDARSLLQIWKMVPEFKILKTIPLSRFVDFYALAWNPEGDVIAAYNSDKQVRIWNINTGILIAQLPGRAHLYPSDLPSFDSLVWSHDGTKLVDVGSDGVAIVWTSDKP